MASTFLRRTRGVVGTMITWAASWSAVGALAGVAVALLAPWPFPEPLHVGEMARAGAFVGIIAGATSGLAWSLALIAAGRRRRFDQLSMRDVAGLGAGAALVASFLISRDLTFTLLCGSLGLTASAGSLAMARKAVGSGEGRLELRTGTE